MSGVHGRVYVFSAFSFSSFCKESVCVCVGVFVPVFEGLLTPAVRSVLVWMAAHSFQ